MSRFPDEEDDILTSEGEAPEDRFEHFRLVSDKGQAPVRLDVFISTHQEKTSRSRVQQAIKAGYVELNGAPAKANAQVKPGDVVTLMMPYERRGVEILPEDIPLDITYEDDDLMVINKPAGMVVHPGHGNYSGTLLNALAFRLGISGSGEDEDDRLGILVHRIDKDTSGLLVVAKNPHTQLSLAKQFFVHSVKREYVAVVWGNLKDDSGTVESAIGRDPSDRQRFRSFDDPEKGKWAVTHYEVIERFGFVTVVKCRLETGRTHQIRVHMASLGHPLFNDARYGGSEIRQGTIYAKYRQFIGNCFLLCPRQALHARTLGFVHPGTGEEMFFEAPLPEDITALIEKWRKYSATMID